MKLPMRWCFAIAFLATVTSCKKNTSNTNLKAITGNDGKSAFALLGVTNFIDVELPDGKGISRPDQAVQTIQSTFLAPVECSLNTGTAKSAMRFMEELSKNHALCVAAGDTRVLIAHKATLINNSEDVLKPFRPADGAEEVFLPCTKENWPDRRKINVETVLLNCSINSTRLVTWSMFHDAFLTTAGIPVQEPTDASVREAALKTYLLAQSLFLSVRGPYDLKNPANNGGSVMKGRLMEMLLRAGVSISKQAALTAWLTESDPFFNPCIKPEADANLWYVKARKRQNFSCDLPLEGDGKTSAYLADYRAGTNGETYNLVKATIAQAIASAFDKTLPPAQLVTSEGMLMNLLSSVVPWSQAGKALIPMAQFLQGSSQSSFVFSREFAESPNISALTSGTMALASNSAADAAQAGTGLAALAQSVTAVPYSSAVPSSVPSSASPYSNWQTPAFITRLTEMFNGPVPTVAGDPTSKSLTPPPINGAPSSVPNPADYTIGATKLDPGQAIPSFNHIKERFSGLQTAVKAARDRGALRQTSQRFTEQFASLETDYTNLSASLSEAQKAEITPMQLDIRSVLSSVRTNPFASENSGTPGTIGATPPPNPQAAATAFTALEQEFKSLLDFIQKAGTTINQQNINDAQRAYFGLLQKSFSVSQTSAQTETIGQLSNAILAAIQKAAQDQSVGAASPFPAQPALGNGPVVGQQPGNGYIAIRCPHGGETLYCPAGGSGSDMRGCYDDPNRGNYGGGYNPGPYQSYMPTAQNPGVQNQGYQDGYGSSDNLSPHAPGAYRAYQYQGNPAQRQQQTYGDWQRMAPMAVPGMGQYAEQNPAIGGWTPADGERRIKEPVADPFKVLQIANPPSGSALPAGDAFRAAGLGMTVGAQGVAGYQ